MNSKQFLKKYMFGYYIVGMFCILFLLITSVSNYIVGKNYENAISSLTVANNLEMAVNELNNSVNTTYLWFIEGSVDVYWENRKQVEQYLAQAETQLEDDYIREMADADSIVETYLEKSDALMESLSRFLEVSGDTPDNELYEEQYNDLQRIYTYLMDGFQSAYSAKLSRVGETEKWLSFWQDMMLVFQLLILVLVLVISFSYMHRMVKQTSASVSMMMKGVQQVQEDVFQAEPIRIESNDEFQEFAEAFNRMTQIIRIQMKKLAETADIKERLAEVEIENLRMFGELQKSHLDFLQSRVNPHFLFNTLNMISSLASLENAEQCARLTENTAAFLRYNLDNIKKTVTLRGELKNLKEYVEIQKCRYGDRYQYFFEVDEECLDFRMPCMILQPLVENAIQHGIPMKISGGYVRITVCRAEDRILLKVRDNGIGMTGEQIREVYEDFREHRMANEHIGLRNIFRRLQLFYHEDVEIELENMKPGLEIRISLPIGGA